MLLVALSLAAPVPAVGSTGMRLATPGQTVVGRPKLTYLELLRMIVTDLQMTNGADARAKGHEVASFRNILGPDGGGDAPDFIEIDSFATLEFKTGGRSRLALLVDLGESEGRIEHTALLALFDLTAAPRLLDLVDIGMDQSVYFADTPLVRLGRNDEALVLVGTHSNSNQSYAKHALVFADGDKWRLIDSFATLSDRYCAFDRDETPHFSTRPGRSPIFSDVVVTVRERQKATGADCGVEKGAQDYARAYTAIYRWNSAKGRFVGDRSALTRLEAVNNKRY